MKESLLKALREQNVKVLQNYKNFFKEVFNLSDKELKAFFKKMIKKTL